jgi:hypothetical protein
MHPAHWDHADHARSSCYARQDWKSCTGLPSSSLTGAGCCGELRKQRPRFSGDREVCQSRLAIMEESRTLSLGRGTS